MEIAYRKRLKKAKEEDPFIYKQETKMEKLKNIWAWILTPYTSWKRNRMLKKKIEELKKRDPFIYK